MSILILLWSEIVWSSDVPICKEMPKFWILQYLSLASNCLVVLKKSLILFFLKVLDKRPRQFQGRDKHNFLKKYLFYHLDHIMVEGIATK